jgi:hypothetical protein
MYFHQTVELLGHVVTPCIFNFLRDCQTVFLYLSFYLIYITLINILQINFKSWAQVEWLKWYSACLASVRP